MDVVDGLKVMEKKGQDRDSVRQIDQDVVINRDFFMAEILPDEAKRSLAISSNRQVMCRLLSFEPQSLVHQMISSQIFPDATDRLDERRKNFPLRQL